MNINNFLILFLKKMDCMKNSMQENADLIKNLI